MYKLLKKLFIKDESREKIGIMMSIFCIVCNLVLVIFKLIVSFITNSQAIRADGLNNLSDMGSNLASLFGFKVSSKHPDHEHPYGHGRVEYVSGLVIGFLIIMMGLSSFVGSLESIFESSTITYNYGALIVVIASILIKFIMGFSNKKAGEEIESETLLAASSDSFNDVLLTSSTLVSLLIYRFFNLNIDSYVGCIVNILVLISGIKIVKEVINVLIGKSPDKELIKNIEEDILKNKEVIGIHDMIFHDYGPASRFLTLHVEVDASKDIIYLHDNIDNIENYILGKYGILTTIHMDPVILNDPELNKYKQMILDVVKDIDSNYSIHDFRIIKGTTHTNLVFDLLLPTSETKDHGLIRKELNEKVRAINPNLNLSVKIEHGFID